MRDHLCTGVYNILEKSDSINPALRPKYQKMKQRGEPPKAFFFQSKTFRNTNDAKPMYQIAPGWTTVFFDGSALVA